ncbi:LysE family translocator [Laribacter hongkongensis]|uniref:LysE family translocator n=1 Tax=Laribacter hongkongensis TaxID=168471 RepID=UPI001EFEDC1D|nr:LysE family translocator [Laribacter hongkongensis]MCG9125451.1 LysE family translocator [Laribacter hongkongensis]
MKLYPLFLLLAGLTVLTPGPGVLMTLTNAMRYGLRSTFGGILGVACGALLASTSLGVLLATSAVGFTLLKLLGAAYLVYLGIRFWRTPPFVFHELALHQASFRRRFAEGMSLQLTNPKVIIFFLSILPQFIDPAADYRWQFCLLVASYGVLVLLIHTVYALGAGRARLWLASERGGRWVRRLGGSVFVGFGVALAGARQ